MKRRTFRMQSVLLATAVIAASLTSAPSTATAADDGRTAETVSMLAGLGLLSVAGSERARSSTSADDGSLLDPDGSLIVPTSDSSGSLTLKPHQAADNVELASGAAIQLGAGFAYAMTAKGAGAAQNAGYVVIQGSDAPLEYAFDVFVDGAPATLTQDGSGAIQVSAADGSPANIISPAWALDARGEMVPTSYRVEGNVIYQSVDHREASYPVVADPRVACDAIWCTLEFNKSETQTASETAGGAAAVLCGGAALLNAAVGFVCGAWGAAFWIAAVQAKNQGDCVAMRVSVIPGFAAPHPAIYNNSYCR